MARPVGLGTLVFVLFDGVEAPQSWTCQFRMGRMGATDER